MKCLRKYEWVKLPRDYPDMGKGLMASWARLLLAQRSAREMPTTAATQTLLRPVCGRVVSLVLKAFWA